MIVAGPSLGPNSGAGSLTGYAMAAYNAATGAPFWTGRMLGFPGIVTLNSQTLAISPDGSTVYVTGNNAVGCCDFDYATVAYAVATGARRWLSSYNGPGNKSDQARALALSPDGSTLYVTGISDRVSPGASPRSPTRPEPQMRQSRTRLTGRCPRPAPHIRARSLRPWLAGDAHRVEHERVHLGLVGELGEPPGRAGVRARA